MSIITLEREIISHSPETMTNDELAAVAISAFARIQDQMPYIIELRKRFQTAARGTEIGGCKSWGEFCETHLYRTKRAVNHAIAIVQPIPSPCPVCEEVLPSKKERGRHVRSAHPDQADEILGVQTFKPPIVAPIPQQKPLEPQEPLDQQEEEESQEKPQKELRPRKEKPTDYKDNFIRKGIEESKNENDFYIIRRKSDGYALSMDEVLDKFEFISFQPLYVGRVFKFTKPVEAEGLYYAPTGKRKEVEMGRDEYEWARVQISIEVVE